MKMIRLAAAAVVLIAGAAKAQQPPRPSAEHERLKQMAGEWDAQVKLALGPGKTQESKGEYTAKIEVGGFFLITEFKGELAGAKFQGRGVTGYDPFKKKYVGTWIDSMSPGIFSTQ